jgi:hypothetical protein
MSNSPASIFLVGVGVWVGERVAAVVMSSEDVTSVPSVRVAVGVSVAVVGGVAVGVMVEVDVGNGVRVGAGVEDARIVGVGSSVGAVVGVQVGGSVALIRVAVGIRGSAVVGRAVGVCVQATKVAHIKILISMFFMICLAIISL